MKKLLFGALILGTLSACNRDELSKQDITTEENSSTAEVQRKCASQEIRQRELENSAELRQKYAELETNTQAYEKALKMGKVLEDGTVEIPVVVNVLYRTTAENVSDNKIAEQITILNNDFGGTNADVSQIPAEFQSVKAGNTKIKFKLANTVRKSTTKTGWTLNDAMKKVSTGGIDATNPTNYLNMWIVGRLTDGSDNVLGYATFPENAGLWKDGIVIASPFFGKTSGSYNLGRTTTHEVGHYLNLKHIWGGSNCGDDLVADTPTQTSANYGNPTYPLYNTCGGVQRSVMFMNFMDYSNDRSLIMFSQGQNIRMNAVVASSGSRAGLRVL